MKTTGRSKAARRSRNIAIVGWTAASVLAIVAVVLGLSVGFLIHKQRAGERHGYAAASGCVYTSKEVVAASESALELYKCAVYHNHGFWTSLDVASLSGCYWDMAANSTTAALISSAMADAEAAAGLAGTRTTEKVGLELILSDLRLVLTLVEQGHYLAATADPWHNYAVFPDLAIEGTRTLGTLTGNDLGGQEGYEGYVLGWLRGYGAALANWRSLMERAVAERKVHAKVVMDVHSQFYLDAYDADYAAVCGTFATEDGVSQCEEATGEIEATLSGMRDYFTGVYLPACQDIRPDEKSGLWAVPSGDIVYQAWLDFHLGYEETARNIYEVGLQRVEENKEDIVTTMQQIDPTITTFEEASASLADSNDTRWYICTNDKSDVIEETTLLKAEIEKYLIPEFGYFPGVRANVQVSGSPSTYSSTGVYDHTLNFWLRPAVYNVGQYEYCYTENGTEAYYYKKIQMSTVAHETSPGHGHQLALGNELDCQLGSGYTSGSSLYIEGWALYSETELYSMGNDDYGPKGLYEDPFYELSFFNAQMLRNVRIVVDPAMHGDISPDSHFSWSDCVSYMVNNSFSLFLAQSECQRYICMPGQADSYMLGNIKMLELRNKTEQALGELFVPSQYHNAILRWNTMNYEQLESFMETFVLYTQDPASSKLDDMFGIDLIREDMFSRSRPTVGLGRVSNPSDWTDDDVKATGNADGKIQNAEVHIAESRHRIWAQGDLATPFVQTKVLYPSDHRK
ncbi:DUF885 family protein [Pelomyxa schiedti]|nr:DUF885 family protein [Pelomyxa schiedti]